MMTNSDHPGTRSPVSAGTEGDGQDNYPTYHDRPGSSGAASGTHATDTNLPRSRRTVAGPMLIGVLAFAAVVLVYVVWSVINMADSTGEAMSPGDAAAPAASGPTVPGSAIDSAEAPGTGEPGLDRDDQPETVAPPAGQAVETPGAVDVPGGATTGQPPATAPAQ